MRTTKTWAFSTWRYRFQSRPGLRVTDSRLGACPAPLLMPKLAQKPFNKSIQFPLNAIHFLYRTNHYR
jgi:hypothetical protein